MLRRTGDRSCCLLVEMLCFESGVLAIGDIYSRVADGDISSLETPSNIFRKSATLLSRWWRDGPKLSGGYCVSSDPVLFPFTSTALSGIEGVCGLEKNSALDGRQLQILQLPCVASLMVNSQTACRCGFAPRSLRYQPLGGASLSGTGLSRHHCCGWPGHVCFLGVASAPESSLVVAGAGSDLVRLVP